MKNLYGRWAEYYDVVYEAQGRDIPFILTIVKKYGGPVLECACGTGRVLIPIAEAGFTIHGIDISDEMLAVLGKKVSMLPAKVRKMISSEKADMRRFGIGRRFRTCIIPFSSLYHLRNDVEMRKFFRCVHEHLYDGGTFLIDVFDFNPETVQNRFVLNAAAKDEKGRVIKKYSKVVFARNQVNHCTERITVEHKGKAKTTGRKFDLHYLMHDQMWKLLEKEGFKVLNVYGNYDHEPYHDGKLNERMIFVAVKKRQKGLNSTKEID